MKVSNIRSNRIRETHVLTIITFCFLEKIDPIAESCKKLWSAGLVPLHIIGASEAVQLIQEQEVGSDTSKFAPLADLVQRLFLGLLQSTNDVLAMEVARRVGIIVIFVCFFCIS